jgi:hypothetical protein
MKTTTALASLFIVALLVIAGAAALVHAQAVQKQTWTEDCGDLAHVNSAGTNVFAYDVIQSFQTEPNGGGWISGDTYQANWTLRLDYVDPNILNDSYYIAFYLPPLNSLPDVTVQNLTNQTQLSQAQKTGTLSATFKAGNTTEGFYKNFDFSYKIYINGAVIDNGVFYERCSISTTIENNQASAEVPEFSSLSAAVTLCIAASVAVLVTVQKRKISRS